MQEACSS